MIFECNLISFPYTTSTVSLSFNTTPCLMHCYTIKIHVSWNMTSCILVTTNFLKQVLAPFVHFQIDESTAGKSKYCYQYFPQYLFSLSPSTFQGCVYFNVPLQLLMPITSVTKQPRRASHLADRQWQSDVLNNVHLSRSCCCKAAGMNEGYVQTYHREYEQPHEGVNHIYFAYCRTQVKSGYTHY